MSEKKYPTDKQIQKILSCYGEYSELPIYNPSDTGPIDTNIYEKKDKSRSIRIEPIEYGDILPTCRGGGFPTSASLVLVR